MAKTDIYYNSFEVAKGNGELEQYRESEKLNIECSEALKNTLENAYKYNMSLSAGIAGGNLIDTFGIERIKIVLANTVQCMPVTKEIYPELREWAAAISVPENDIDHRLKYAVDFFPAWVNRFIGDMCDYERAMDVADYIIQQGVQNTTEGNWTIRTSEIPGDLIEYSLLMDSGELIASMLSQREEVADAEYDGSCFDVCYNLAYCPSYEPTPEEIAEHGVEWPTGELMELLEDVAGSIYENNLQQIVDERRFTAHEDVAHDLTPAQVKQYQDIIAGFLKEQAGVTDVQVGDGGFSVGYYYEHTPGYVPVHSKLVETRLPGDNFDECNAPGYSKNTGQEKLEFEKNKGNPPSILTQIRKAEQQLKRDAAKGKKQEKNAPKKDAGKEV